MIPHQSSPFGTTGAAMPLVLIFSVIVAITVTLYLSGQSRIARMELSMPSRLQTLLTARSGVWWAMDRLRDTTGTDTLKTIDTRSDDFTHGLFDTDTASDIPKLADDGTPVEVSPFSSDSFGTALVSLAHEGAFRIIESHGTFRNKTRAVFARIGGSVVFSGDTLLYVKIQTPTLVASCVRGTKAGSFDPSREVRDSLVQKVITSYTKELTQDTTMGMADIPLTIQKNADVAKIPEIVNGPLFIDGSFWEVRWKEKRTVRVMGDLQITGACALEDLSFVVLGEIKILDKARLKNVSLFCGGRLFIGDETVFAGHALSMGSVTIYGRAQVRDRSTIVAAGSKSTPIASKKSSAGTTRYGIILAESATIDGSLFALRAPGSIKTDRNVLVTGMLFAVNELSHAGKLRGIAKATRVIDGSDSTSIKENVMTGCIEPLNELDSYLIPGFIGDPAIVSWREE